MIEISQTKDKKEIMAVIKIALFNFAIRVLTTKFEDYLPQLTH